MVDKVLHNVIVASKTARDELAWAKIFIPLAVRREFQRLSEKITFAAGWRLPNIARKAHMSASSRMTSAWHAFAT